MAEIEKQNPENEQPKESKETVKKEEEKKEESKPTSTTSGKPSPCVNSNLKIRKHVVQVNVALVYIT